MKKVILTIVKIVVFFMGWAILAGIIDVPSDEPVVWRFFAELIPLIVMLLFTVIFYLIEKKEIRIPIFRHAGRGLLIGTIVGVIWIAIPAVLLIGTKHFVMQGKANVPYLGVWIVSAFLNVIMQELLVRGYIYQLLKTRYNLPAAVIVTTAIFTLLHGGAFEAGIIAVINVITMCLFTTALYEAEETLWAPIMAHAVWNIVAAIILGVDSLAEDYPSLYSMAPSGNALLSGGDYEISGSILVTVMNILLLLLFYMIYRRRNTEMRRAHS